MNPRNTFYRRDRRAVDRRPSLSLSLSFLRFCCRCPFVTFSPLLPGMEGGPFYFALAEIRGERRPEPRNNETASRIEAEWGEERAIYFPLDGSDTGSRVYTRELDATSRGDSGCRPVHAQAPKRHLNYRLRLFMSRRSPTLAHLIEQRFPRFLQLFLPHLLPQRWMSFAFTHELNILADIEPCFFRIPSQCPALFSF